MVVREKSPGVLEVKDNKKVFFFIGLFLVLAGLSVLFIDFLGVEGDARWFLGGFIILVGSLLALLWRDTTVLLDQQQGAVTITTLSIRGRREKRCSFADVEAVEYVESIRQHESSVNSRSGARGSFSAMNNQGGYNVERSVFLVLKNAERFLVLSSSSTRRSLASAAMMDDRSLLRPSTKSHAERIASFIGVPLRSSSLGDAVKDFGNKLLGSFGGAGSDESLVSSGDAVPPQQNPPPGSS